MITVLKLGGELLEDVAAIESAAVAILHLASRSSVVVVHGGGRAIDAELRRRGLTPRFADGLRITDAEALDAVVTVLAGRTNTQLVAAVAAAGGKAVGLTGADAHLGLCSPAPPIKTQAGEVVDLGMVGEPITGDMTVVNELLRLGVVPIVASIGATIDGMLMNINADTFAAHLSASLGAQKLIVAGTTAGVFDEAGQTIPAMTPSDVGAMMASRVVHSGMVAKLAACRHAVLQGVNDVSIVAGRGVLDFETAPGTRFKSLSACGETVGEK